MTDTMADHITRKQVTIEMTYRKIKGRVFWYWRLFGMRKWNKQLTSYKELPWGYFTDKRIRLMNVEKHI